MPSTSKLTSAVDSQLLLQLGARLKRARVAQGLTTTEMAQRAGMPVRAVAATHWGFAAFHAALAWLFLQLGPAGKPLVVSDEVIKVHQRDLHESQVPGTQPGQADFDAWVRVIDKIDRSWRD